VGVRRTHAAIDAINASSTGPLSAQAVDSAGGEALPRDRRAPRGWPRHRRSAIRTKSDRATAGTSGLGSASVPGRNQHSFRLVHGPTSAKGKQLLDAPASTGYQLPVVITASSGETLVEPTNGELAPMLGLSTSPSVEVYELAVIGADLPAFAAAV